MLAPEARAIGARRRRGHRPKVDLGNRVPRQDRRERCPGPENDGTDRTSEHDGEQQRVRGVQTAWAGG